MNIINAFLSAMLFYLIPTLAGRAILMWRKHVYTGLSALLAYWSIGSLTIYGFMLVTFWLANSIYPSYVTDGNIRIASIAMIAVLSVINCIRLPHISINRHSIMTVLGIGIIWACTLTLWRGNSPYPSILNWDIFEHQTLVNSISNGTLTVRTSAMSDTFQFNGYPTMFHVLVAAAQIPLQSDILGFWWMIEALHLFITVCISYLFGKALSSSRFGGYIGAVIGAFTFESTVTFTSLFLMPQTVAALFVAGTVILLASDTHEGESWPVAIITLTTALLFHLVVGTVGIALVGAYILAKRVVTHTKHILTFSTLTPIVIVGGLWLINRIFGLTSLNAGEAKNYIFSYIQMDVFFRTWYGLGLYITYPVGFLFLVLSKKQTHKIIAFVSLAALSLTVSPVPYALKFYSVGRYLVHAVMAYGLWSVFSRISGPLIRLIPVAIFVLSIGYVFVLNSSQWKQNVFDHNTSSEVSKDEISAAKFLKKTNINGNSYLISDPASQGVLEALSGVNSQGGMYAQKDTREIVSEILKTDTGNAVISLSKDVHDLVISRSPNTYFFVVTGRTIAWEKESQENKMSFAFNVWIPKQLTLEDIVFLNSFEEKTGLIPMYENTSMRIYKLEAHI